MYSASRQNAYIVEDNNKTPRVEVYEDVNVGNKLQKLVYGEVFAKTREYKIIVPKETLTDEFNIDMKN